MGRPIKAIRWTCDHAGSEFGADSKTISARLRQAGTAAGADGKFSTRQIVLAVFGDIDGERLREKRHQANLLEIEEKRMIGEFFDSKRVVQIWESQLVALRTALWNFDAPEVTRRRWMDELKAIAVAEYQENPPPVEAEEE